MKANSIIKRVLSTVLVMVMLFSCWVFTAPTAEAAGNNTYSGTAGSYSLTLNYSVSNSGGSDSYLKVNITYTTDNGYGTTGQTTGDKSCTVNGSSKTISVPGWPTSVSWKAKGQAWDIYEGHFSSATINGTSAWTGTSGWDSGGGFYANEKSGSFSLSATKPRPVVDSCTMPDYSTAFSKGNNPSGSSNFVDVSSSTNTNALSGDFSYSPETIVDQYGVAIGGTLTPKYTITDRYRSSGSTTSWSSNSDDSSYNVTSSNGTVTASKAAGYPYHYCTVKAYLTWSLNSTDYDTGSTKDVGFDFPTYNVNYNYWTTEFFERTDTEMPTDNPEKEYVPFNYTTVTAATHTALYGDAPTQNPPTPDSNLKYYFGDKTHWYLKDSWTKPTSVTANPKDVNLGDTSGSAASHSWSGTWVSFEGEAAYHGYGPEDFHRQSCSVYADHDRNGVHYKFQWHQWDTPVFTFASDGKSATVTRQCKTTGCRQTQTQTLTLDNGIVATVKTPATCTTDGVHTYTATSPWGDGATKSVDKTDISAPGHDWKTPTFKFADDGKTANATRVCNTDANHTETSAAVVTSRVKTKATCETDGVTTYTATSPWKDETTDSVDKTDIPAKGHNTTGQPWVSDATNHWKVCLNDSTHKLENAAHSWGDWTDKGNGKHTHTCTVCRYESEQTGHNYKDEVTAPTCTADGFITYTCLDCGYIDIEYPYTEREDENYKALGHELDGVALVTNDAEGHYKVCNRCGENIKSDGTIGKDTHTNTRAVRTEATIKTRPTCTEAGEYYFTCSECGRIDNEYYTVDDDGEGKALGHDWVITDKEAVDNYPGYVYYCCERNCGNYHLAKFENGEYSVDEQNEYTSISQMEQSGNKVSIPAPYFNDASSEAAFYGNPYYAQRPASFKKMSDSEMGKQTIRFAGSVKIPAGIGYDNVNDKKDNNSIIDFGFVYTQDERIDDVSNIKIDGKDNQGFDIQKMSVRENNYQKDAQGNLVLDENGKPVLIDQNIDHWSGCTVQTISTGEHYITFNLVINIKAKNWHKEYAGRPYIIYKYNGIDYTVYDSGVSSGEDDKGKIRIPYFHRSINELADSIMKFNQYFDRDGTVIDSEGTEMSVEEFIYYYYVEPGVSFETFSQMAQGYIDDKAYVERHIIAHCDGDADFTNKAAVKADLFKDESKWLTSSDAKRMLNNDVRELFPN